MPDFSERFWEIDSLRGIAIILMVISNFATDLAYFNIANLSSGFWWLFARLTAAIFLFLVGLYLPNIIVATKWLLPLGLAPENYNYIDYFPIFPWIGVILIGLFFGSVLYHGHKRKISIPDYSSRTKLLQFLGRNSLLIYLVHQPVIIATLLLLGILNSKAF